MPTSLQNTDQAVSGGATVEVRNGSNSATPTVSFRYWNSTYSLAS